MSQPLLVYSTNCDIISKMRQANGFRLTISDRSLTRTEEAELAHTAKRRVHGHPTEAAVAARNQLVKSCVPLAVRLARNMDSRMDVGELMAESLLWLVHAVDRFDPARNCRLSTYMVRVVRRGLLKYCMKHSHVIASTSQPTHPAGDAADPALLDLDGGIASCDEADERRHRSALAAAWIVDLPPRTQEILRLRFHEGLKLRDIAARVGISYQRVMQIIQKAVAALRARAAESGPEE